MLDIVNLTKSITKEVLNKDTLSTFSNQIEERLKNMGKDEVKEYTVDRFEGNYAVLENRQTKEMVNIEKDKLPQNISEGNILKYQNGNYTIDNDLQKEVEERIRQKMNDLWTN